MAKEEIEPKEAPLNAGFDLTTAKEEIEPKEAPFNAGFDLTIGSSGDNGIGGSMRGEVMDSCHVCAVPQNACFDLTTGSSGDNGLEGSMRGGVMDSCHVYAVTPLCGGQCPTFLYKKYNKINYVW